MLNSVVVFVFLQLVLYVHVCFGSSSNLIVNTTFWGSGKSQDSDEPSRHRLKEKISGGPIGYDGSPVFLFTPRDTLLPPNVKGTYCRLPAQCEPLNYTTCLGAKLTYSSTTLKLVGDSSTQEQVQDKLRLWQGLRHIPKCWAVIQPFLCAVYMPKCEEEQVDLPSQEMCKMTMGPCRILYNDKNFPSFLKCDDLKRFPPMCKNDVREMKFNTSGTCQAPLVPTDNALAYYDGVDGCGVQCHDPMFTADEHRQIRQLVGWGGTVALLFNLFTVVTFIIDWRSANKYPALIIFYINVCFLVANCGWLAQFMPDARDDIVCRKDGTLRMGEPSAGENLSCVIVFVLVYYFLIAGIVWFVILTYAWHLSFQALGKIQERIDKKGAYFHLAAWSLPLVLTITTMALGEIDGNSITGICFVGYLNQPIRAGFLLGPIVATLLVGGYFLSRGLLTLVKLKINSEEIISERASGKIRQTILRMGLFSLLTLTFMLATFVCHIYEFKNSHLWKESFRKYIVCRITSSGSSNTDEWLKCKMDSRPSVAMLQLHLLALFSAGVVMSSWVWTAATVDTWKRGLRRKLYGQADDEPVKLKKHKVIAQAFAKRKTFNNAGRMSISFHSSHEDPVGLNFDMHSLASQDFSSTWAAALPKLMTRRGALIGVNTGSVSSQRSQRRNSMDSEISFSVRRVSVESRRHSLDSQVSVHIAELTATRKTAAATPVPSGGRYRTRHKKRRRTFGQQHRTAGSSRPGPLFSRRESTTSQESQLSTQVNEILTALTIGSTGLSSYMPNLMKRRSGNAGLGGKLALPFAVSGQSPDISDEENSGDPLHKSFEKIDIVTCGQGPHDGLLYNGNVSDGPEYLCNIIDEGRGSKTSDKKGRKSQNTASLLESESRKSRNYEEGGRKSKNSQKDSLLMKNTLNESFNHVDFLRDVQKSIDAIRSKSRESDKNKEKNIVELYDTDEEEAFCKPSDLQSVDAVMSDNSTSFCPELVRLAVLSSHSGVSVSTQCDVETDRLGHPRDSGNYSRAREIGTQTSNSIEDIKMDKLYDRIEYHPARSHQCTQVSPVAQRAKSMPPVTKRYRERDKSDEVSQQLLDESRSASSQYYNTRRLVQELLNNQSGESQSIPERRKSKDLTKSVDNALSEGRRERIYPL